MDTIKVFGQSYSITPLYNPAHPLGVFLSGDKLIINHHSLATRPDKKLINQKITNWLELLAQKYILQKVPVLAQKMDLTNQYRRVCLKHQSTRWGSCSSHKNLNFNYALVHQPPELIDYVIIHELAHLREMNHSAAFWRIVARYDPLHKLHRRQLNKRS